MDLTQLAQQMAELSSALPMLQQQLRERAVQEAVAGGAMVRVVPAWFPRPRRAERGRPAEVDPWFGLTKADWCREMADGFRGWMETTEGSAKPKVMINYAAAEKWLDAKWKRQAERRENAEMLTN